MIDTEIIITLAVGLVFGFAAAAAYFIIWRTPKRISYGAAKAAFKAANLVVTGAQRELQEGLKIASQATIDVEKSYEAENKILVRTCRETNARLDSALSYTKKLRSALRDFLNELTPEEQTGTLPRTLQIQTIKAAVRELNDIVPVDDKFEPIDKDGYYHKGEDGFYFKVGKNGNGEQTV